MTDSTTAEEGRSAERGRRSRGWRRAKLGCGCGAFLFGAVAALLMLAPLLFGRFVLDEAVKALDEEIAGEVELEEVSLSWLDHQRVAGLRLRDPEGRTVGELDLALPPLWDMVRALEAWGRGERADFGTLRGTAEVALSTAPGAPSNWERALAPARRARDGASKGGSDGVAGAPTDGEREVEVSTTGDPRLLAFTLLLDVKHVGWTDPRLDAEGRPFALHDLRAELVVEPGEPARLEFRGEHVLGERRGPLAGEFAFDLPAVLGGAAPATALRGELTAEGLPAGLVEGWLGDAEGARRAAGALLTEPVDLALALAPEEGGGTRVALEADAGASRAELTLLVDLDEERVRRAGTIRASLTADPEGLPALAGEAWPAGLVLAEPDGGRVPLELAVDELDWPLREGPGAVAARIELGGFVATNDALRAAGERVGVASATGTLRAARTERVAVELALRLDGGGALDASARTAEALVGVWSGATPTWSVELAGDGLPTAPVDALAAQDGLLVDVLGPRLRLAATATEVTAAGARVDATLESDRARLALAGRIADGVLVAEEGAGRISANVGLTPLFRERVVGPLLPMLVGVEPLEGGSPTSLEVTDFRLPLGAEGDEALRGLRADVRLDLGQVRAAVLPDLARWLSSRVHRARPTDLPSLALRVEDGRVVTESIPIEIEGAPLSLSGSYALAGGGMDLRCEVPLSSLRGDVGAQIEAAREYLDPGLTIPLRLRGTPSAPRIDVAPDFLKTLIEQGGQRAIEKAIGDTVEKEVGDAIEKGLRDLFGGDD